MASPVIDKEGELRKRGGRMLRWSHRYFVLSGPKLSYKLRADSANFRDDFDLSPGCIVTDISEEMVGTIKGKKIYVFWVVWPHDKHQKNPDHPELQSLTIPEESDDEEDTKEQNKDNKLASQKTKHLKGVIKNELNQQKVQQQKVEEQIERHHIHDKNVNTGAKVAAVAAGGVVIGVFTAGIGLIPYLTAVGIAAAVGGGVAAMQIRTQYKRPFDSRLVLACESMNEAISWKLAIQHQISLLDVKPVLPATANPSIVSNIIGLSRGSRGFRVAEVVEGVRILESVEPMEGTLCYRAQLVVHCTPFNAFLSVMDGKCWPRHGAIKVLKNIDDHADLIRADVLTDCRRDGGRHWVSRSVCLSRFWKLEDDGMYLIVLNSAPDEDLMQKDGDDSHASNGTNNGVSEPENRSTIKKKYIPFGCDIVLTIAPRVDAHEMDEREEVVESLIQCTMQVSKSSECQWEKGELQAFTRDFLVQNLLDLSHSITENRFTFLGGREAKDAGMSASKQVSHHTTDGSESPRLLSASHSVSVTEEYGNPTNPVKMYEHKSPDFTSPIRREVSPPKAVPASTVIDSHPAPVKRRFLFSRTHAGRDTPPLASSPVSTSIPVAQPIHTQDDSYLYATNAKHLSTTQTSPPKQASTPIASRAALKAAKTMRRQRSRAVKNEIDTKEYQLKRLCDQQASARYTEEDMISELRAEIDKLKHEFYELTGSTYEEIKATSRSLYKRGRRYFSSTTGILSRHTTDGSGSPRANEKMISDSRDEKDIDIYDQYFAERSHSSTSSRTPFHWALPTRSLRCDLYMDSVASAQNGTVTSTEQVKFLDTSSQTSVLIAFGIFVCSTFAISQYFLLHL